MKTKLLFLFKKIIPHLLFQFICFTLVILFSITCVNVSSEAFSYYLTKYSKNAIGYNYCEVKSDDPNDTYNKFFNLADDYIGVEAKIYSDTFFFCKDRTLQLNINDSGYVNNDKVFASALGYTTYNFAKYSMGMMTLSGTSIRNLASKEIYITETLAKQICSHDNILSLIGQTIDVVETSGGEDSLCTIVDIIKNSSIPSFIDNNLLDTSFLIYNNTVNRKFVYNKSYCVFLKGDYLSMTYIINKIETVISYLNSFENEPHYESLYYDFNDSEFDIGRNEVTKEKTYNYYSKISLVPFTISLLLLLILSALYLVYVFKKASLNFNFEFLTSLFSLFIFLFLLRIIGGFYTNNVFIFLFNSKSIAILFFYWLLIALFFYFIYKNKAKRNNSQFLTGLSNYKEINI